MPSGGALGTQGDESVVRPGNAERLDGDRRKPLQPRPSPLTAYDAVFLVGLNVGVVTWMWFRHGGLSRSGDFDEWLVSFGQLTGLYAGLAVLLGLVLASRAPWLERRYGMDQMLRAHRVTGFTAACLMVGHVLTITIGLARDTRISLWDQIVDYVRNYPYLIGAIIGFCLFMVVVLLSIRASRRRLSHETWWAIHLATYAAAALTFGHQTAVGADFVLDRWAFVYWSLLWASVALLIIGYRWLALGWGLARRRLHISAVEDEDPGVVTLAVAGRGLEAIRAQSGQFFLLRVLDRRRFWKAHPFSLSAPPDGHSLRFTIKAFGDDTTALQTIAPGTRVAVEGPYGGFLDAFPTERKVLFIAGGIGITPFRGMLEDFDRPQDITLLYRNTTPDKAVFRDDLHRLSREKGFDLHMSYSRVGDEPDPFTAEALLHRVPDIGERDVFVVGSPRLVAAAKRGVRLAGVPTDRVHLETFTY
jgi:predicted ferric reductase